MTATQHQPISVNLQSPLQFKFVLARAPSLSFYCQDVQLPSIQLPPANVPTPTVKVPYIGDHINYEPLTLTFKVDDNLEGYFEIFNWMTSLANPNNNGAKFQNLENNKDYSGYGVYSEIQTFLLDSQNNPTTLFTFHRAWPSSLSGMKLDSKSETLMYINSTVTFYYSHFSITTP